MIFVGIDCAEEHHDVCVLNSEGRGLGRRRIPDTLAGGEELHALVGGHAGEDDEPDQVVMGIEKDRGLIVTDLVTSGYQVFAVNPLAAARYHERHHVTGAKSDPGDAKVLGDLVRTDRINHRQVAGDSTLAQAVNVLARARSGVHCARANCPSLMSSKTPTG
jgi:hypothetical protein